MSGRGRAGSVVVWFRRDLRTEDHPALAAAAADAAATGRRVAPLFVVDDRLVARAGANRCTFLAGCLDALDGAVEGSLAVRAGRPGPAVAAFAEEVGARTVFATGDAAPYGRRRDDEAGALLAGAGVDLVLVDTPYAVPPGQVCSRSGRPYRVFTPYRRAWEAHGWAPPLARPSGIRWRAAGDDGGRAALAGAGAGPRATRLPDPGPDAGRAALEAFAGSGLAGYAAERDRPGRDGTSRLSPYLRFGCLHPRQVLARLGTQAAFRSEIAWREFHADVLWHRPASAWRSLDPVGAALRWDEGPGADRRFSAWTAGRTGYPLVDAGMRQLLAEGWMHNRVRMLTASFLVKDLHVDWRRGARWFLDCLVDGDVASNNHGWQWVAGTGTDAAPFHRIFNPTVQRARFDPDGTYVDRYVPDVGGPGYPPPIVDHAAERADALRRWQDARLAVAASPGGAGGAGGADR